jgi:hypothetical protein
MVFEQSNLFEDLLVGRIGNYLAFDEIEALMEWLMESYGGELMY